MAAQYGSPSYWDERYKRDGEFFDWYQRWSGIKDTVKDRIHKTDRILIVGCGTSKLSEDLFDDGYKHQVNIDVSKTAIDIMKGHYHTKPSMEFKVMNVLDMNDFDQNTFDVVIDKGTFDSILCGESSTTNAFSMLKEVSRVLKPNGRYICVTFGEPRFRISYIDRPEYNWNVEIRAVPKPVVLSEVALGADASAHYIYVGTKSAVESQREEN